mmetsp:Transcript_14321/g.41986  ORF Transcript_14321/g.41986 Transcript_14321/m.41986 type:complete len:274 (+) Transcript_14321:10-831(+)
MKTCSFIVSFVAYSFCSLIQTLIAFSSCFSIVTSLISFTSVSSSMLHLLALTRKSPPVVSSTSTSMPPSLEAFLFLGGDGAEPPPLDFGGGPSLSSALSSPRDLYAAPVAVCLKRMRTPDLRRVPSASDGSRWDGRSMTGVVRPVPLAPPSNISDHSPTNVERRSHLLSRSDPSSSDGTPMEEARPSTRRSSGPSRRRNASSHASSSMLDAPSNPPATDTVELRAAGWKATAWSRTDAAASTPAVPSRTSPGRSWSAILAFWSSTTSPTLTTV